MSTANKPRLLLVGHSETESVIDCYRRALAPFYEITVFDPFDLTGFARPLLGERRIERLNVVAVAASRLVAREPLALTLPRLSRLAADLRPDIVLTDCIESLPPATVAKLRQGSTLVLGVFSDHVANFGRGYFFDADYDALFFKDHYIVDTFRKKLGWRHVFFLPQACDTERHRPVPLTEDDRHTLGCDLAIASNPYAYRTAFLAALNPRDIKLYGPTPPRWLKSPVFSHHQGRYVIGVDKAKAMRAAKIVLNSMHYAEIAGTNKRLFEMAALGAFQLTDAPGLADVFVPDVEVATFTTLDDCREKIAYWLARPDEREQMAVRASVRAHREHTYAHRFSAKLAAVKCSAPQGLADGSACPAR
jgi:spore maturation protein CgeB